MHQQRAQRGMPKIHVKYHTDPWCANPKCRESTALAAEKAAGATQIEHMPRCKTGGKGGENGEHKQREREREQGRRKQRCSGTPSPRDEEGLPG